MTETLPADPARDLAPPTEPLRPEFPAAIDGTRLVLYPGATQELRVRWSLDSNDFMSYGAGFPPADGRPEAVLRLRRLRDGGDSETLQEVRLRRSSIGGSGDVAFDVGDDHDRFDAELGLANEEGGWLSLARSNRLQHAKGIELESVDWDAVRAARQALIPSQVAAPAASGIGERSRLGLRPGESLVGATHSVGEAHSGGLSLLDAREPGTPGRAMPPGAEENATPSAFPIPTLVYGKPATRGAELVIEAELHIRGWGTPNSEVELFGHPYRIGPGGRFELVLKVDDPDLLKAALTQHPPPELGSQRED